MDAAGPKTSPGTTDASAEAKPKGLWDTILTTTPIVLTVLATAFAGLSSSEMTQSMYNRSLAAQHQAKAGDQWAFFQAKRIRGTNLEMTLGLLRSLTHPDPFEPEQLETVSGLMLQKVEKIADAKKTEDASPEQRQAAAAAAERIKKAHDKIAALLDNKTARQSLAFLTAPQLPKAELATVPNTDVQATLDALARAIADRQTETATADLVGRLTPEDIDQATRIAEENADRFEKACEPVQEMLKKIQSIVAELGAAVQPLRKTGGTSGGGSLAEVPALFDGLDNSVKAAAIDFDARRYRYESLLNRKAAELYEIRVRRSGLQSDRHRARSINFFYSMLIAQLGVTVSSLALAQRQRSALWLIAALAGVAALGFTGYVYVSF